MNSTQFGFLFVTVVFAIVIGVPLAGGSAYVMSVGVNTLQYAVMATAWAMFSGPTRYISLATSSFYGVGVYSVAVLADILPWPAVLLAAFALGAMLALLVGLATLRLSGVYFVIFTFGLGELVRQLVTWYEVNVTGTMIRYVFINVSSTQIYWQLAILLAAVLATGWWIYRTRLGTALRLIGEDEVVASHVGVNTALVKLMLFAISSGFIAVAGAIMAPRWTYIDPGVAFNMNISFLVLIMALLGGTSRLLGPIVGAVPVVLLLEVLTVNFPNHYSILVGLVFITIVYFIPEGVLGRLVKRKGSAVVRRDVAEAVR
ncbi:branched-chain amino acid ABC transporter permease [Oceaniradius stylonematis]|uniref:branched-chain amino acid ABC transporter permease n=1 Tax=Oceaniradius stylonematis TaxID=2184161 RepID=UPI00273D50C5|nr:branched-chain amino acid ABC transporter permease [Oceaniradius stylonematis]